jgi:hypothetical protein
MDSTAGRFRCISCNRDAGPLQEQINERMTKASFPPSPMLVQPSQSSSQQQQQQQASQQPSQPQRSIVNSRQAVPGLREYGGSMTTSRKKLMNYYQWLQEKSDHPNPSRPRPTSGRAESPRTISPSHPWSGERQCGDHGTPEPEAVGVDGKYYVGVISTGTVTSSRPRSAPHYGRRPEATATVSPTAVAEPRVAAA